MKHQLAARGSWANRLVSLLAALALATSLCGAPTVAFAASADRTASAVDSADPIVIVHTNDVHNCIDQTYLGQTLGYAALSSYVDAMEEAYGEENVTLVDAGDAVQGNVVGTLSQGEYLVELMNQVGYDIAVPGNHEFDYGMAQFDTLVALSDADYLACNFMDLRTGATALDPYRIVDYGEGDDAVQVAYVGIATPETLTKSSPSTFQDEGGSYVYGFCQDDTGEALYGTVQASVDAARTEGADYVVAVAHLGQTGITEQWRSDALVRNTTGIDAVIDGHSHEAYVQKDVENADGEAVPIVQTGYGLQSIGTVTIRPDTGEVSAELVDEWGGSDPDTAALVADVNARVMETAGRVVGSSEVELAALEDDGYTWAVRQRETNLGDFVADAYRAYARSLGLDADVAFVNGGGLRADVASGDVTYGDLINVNPYSNQLIMVEATGQQIVDALEVGASALPAPDGGFLQVSGLSYTVRTDIPSAVRVDDAGFFQGVDGEYRVRDVTVDGEPIDLDRTYNLVSIAYLLQESGDGMTMFLGLDSVLVGLDSEALIGYISDDLGGVIGQEYANEGGQGRIVLAEGPDEDPEPYRYADVQDEGAWYFESVYAARDAGYLLGYGGTDLFGPTDVLTRGQAACVLARIAGADEGAEFEPSYADVSEGAYCSAAVAWARQAGVMTGYDDGTGRFGPDDPITREQLASALSRLAAFLGVGDGSAVGDLSSYPDEAAVSGWARDAVAWAVGNGIMGDGGSLRPQDGTTRGEAAKMTVSFADAMAPAEA